MMNFSYYGRDEKGMAISGNIERSSESDVASYLSKNNITPIKIKAAPKPMSIGDTLKKIGLFSKKIDDAQLIMFCRQMYTINKAGLPLIQGLESLAASIPAGTLKSCLLDIIQRLESGASLSRAMYYHPNIFNKLFVGMMKIGESTGNLDKVFLQMTDYIGRDIETKKAIKSALRYPTFVMSAMFVALFVINVMVIPAFADMFSRFGAELPLPTRVLLHTSHFFVNYWWIIILCLALSIIACMIWVKTPEGCLFWHRCKLKIPVVGSLITKAAMSRYIRSFSLMLSAGLPLNKAIGLCADIIDNQYLAIKIKKIKTDVERGDSLYRTHSRSNMFSPLILQMINVGENSGQVDTLLSEVADSYEREVDYDLKTLSSTIEPILIMLMAGLVVVLALGIFLPMWEMFNIQQ
ncbi:MAG: MSHA biogenesis protein MshG [Candidatus Endobugula sp.]|jgi:MSHA biogenesis protein MshG